MDVLDRPGSRALLMCADLARQLNEAERQLAALQRQLDAAARLARGWQAAPGGDPFGQATRIAGAELADALSGETGWGSWMRHALGARLRLVPPPPG